MLQTVRQKHKRKSPTMLSGSTTSSLDPEMYRRTKVCAKTGARNSLSAKKLSFTHSANKKQNGVFFLNRALSISPKASVACSNTSHTNTHKSHYYLASGRHLSLFFFCYINVTLLQTRTVHTSTAPKWSHRKTSHALRWSRQAVCPFLGFNSYTLSFNSSVKFQKSVYNWHSFTLTTSPFILKLGNVQ